MIEFGHRFLGLACAFLNTGLSSAGFILQRKAHLISENGHTGQQQMRHLGIALYIVAALPDVLAYTMIPQVLCATVACFRLVVVCVLGHIFLEEHLQTKDARSIGVCTAGTMLCVLFGPGGDDKTAASMDSSNIYHPKVVIYSIVALSLLVVFLAIVHADSFGWIVTDSKLYRYSLPVATALAYAVEKVYNTELGFIQRPQNILLEPMWLFMVIAVALLGLTDFYLNVRAAERMPVHLFVPLSFAFGHSLQCFQAMVIFDEFDDMTVFCSTMTLLGACLSLIGALMIQQTQFDAPEKQTSRSFSESPKNGSKKTFELPGGNGWWDSWYCWMIQCLQQGNELCRRCRHRTKTSYRSKVSHIV